MATLIEGLTGGKVAAEDWGYVVEDLPQGAVFLQRHILAHGESVARLALRWGMSATGLRAVIAGREEPTDGMLKRMSEHVGLRLEASDFKKAA